MPTARRKRGEKGRANPLAMAFGRAIEELRDALQTEGSQMESRQAAAAIGLSAAAYRLIELGRYPLHPSKTLALADRLELHWPNLIRVVAAIQAVDACKTESEATATEELARSRDPDLRELLSGPKWEKLKTTPAAKPDRAGTSATDNVANFVPRLKDFLTNRPLQPRLRLSDAAFANTVGHYPIKIAPYYYEVLRPTLDRLTKALPPRINAGLLAQFERENGPTFRSVFGVLRTIDLLEEDFSRPGNPFPCTYLLRREFKWMRLAVADRGGQSTDELTRRLRIALEKSWLRERPEMGERKAKRGRLLLTKANRAALSKMRVQGLSDDSTLNAFLHYDSSKEEFCEPANRKEVIPLMHVWLYVSADNAVVFADGTGAGGGTPFTTSCNGDETLRLLEALEGFWEGSTTGPS